MSGKHYPIRWVKTVTDFGSFVDMVGVSGPREYVIVRNDGETFSAHLYETVTGVEVNGVKQALRINLKHRVSLDECIEDCEGYENAVNPPPGFSRTRIADRQPHNGR